MQIYFFIYFVQVFNSLFKNQTIHLLVFLVTWPKMGVGGERECILSCSFDPFRILISGKGNLMRSAPREACNTPKRELTNILKISPLHSRDAF